MNSQLVREMLKSHTHRLRELGVESLSLFGSVARDQASPGSDVDLLVQFAGPPSFDRYMDLKLLLEESLGAKVDLVTPRALRPALRHRIEKDAIRVA